jgi:hypothetical protein
MVLRTSTKDEYEQLIAADRNGTGRSFHSNNDDNVEGEIGVQHGTALEDTSSISSDVSSNTHSTMVTRNTSTRMDKSTTSVYSYRYDENMDGTDIHDEEDDCDENQNNNCFFTDDNNEQMMEYHYENETEEQYTIHHSISATTSILPTFRNTRKIPIHKRLSANVLFFDSDKVTQIRDYFKEHVGKHFLDRNYRRLLTIVIILSFLTALIISISVSVSRHRYHDLTKESTNSNNDLASLPLPTNYSTANVLYYPSYDNSTDIVSSMNTDATHGYDNGDVSVTSNSPIDSIEEVIITPRVKNILPIIELVTPKEILFDGSTPQGMAVQWMAAQRLFLFQ